MERLEINEITYRGIEDITTPDELCHIFEITIKSLPNTVTKDRCIEEFGIAWAVERGLKS